MKVVVIECSSDHKAWSPVHSIKQNDRLVSDLWSPITVIEWSRWSGDHSDDRLVIALGAADHSINDRLSIIKW